MKRFIVSFENLVSEEHYHSMKEEKLHIPTNLQNILDERVDNLPRSVYLTWGDYFMSVALLSAQRSKDPEYINRASFQLLKDCVTSTT